MFERGLRENVDGNVLTVRLIKTRQDYNTPGSEILQYSSHEPILGLYMFAAKFTLLPVIGGSIEVLMRWYVLSLHKAS